MKRDEIADANRIQWRLATAGERLAAFAIDASLFVLIFMIGMAIQMAALHVYQSRLGPGNFPDWPITFMTIWIVGLIVLTAIETIPPGWSVGKKCLRLRIFDVSGDPARLRALSIRWLIKCSPLLVWFILIFVPLGSYGLGIFPTWLLASLAGYCLVFGPRHRALHDRLAGTMVSKLVSVRGRFEVIPAAAGRTQNAEESM